MKELKTASLALLTLAATSRRGGNKPPLRARSGPAAFPGLPITSWTQKFSQDGLPSANGLRSFGERNSPENTDRLPCSNRQDN
jgi:hypothetical protein